MLLALNSLKLSAQSPPYSRNALPTAASPSSSSSFLASPANTSGGKLRSLSSTASSFSWSGYAEICSAFLDFQLSTDQSFAGEDPTTAMAGKGAAFLAPPTDRRADSPAAGFLGRVEARGRAGEEVTFPATAAAAMSSATIGMGWAFLQRGELNSTELWLVQWQPNQLQPDDFQGKELTLKLNRDGKLGRFDSSSGKSYEFVSFSAQEPDANVIIASASESKVVGKISRRVSLVHYPEPSELEKLASAGHASSAGSTRKSRYGLMSASKSGRTKSSGAIVREILNDLATPGSSKQRDTGIVGGTSFESGALGKHSAGWQSSSRDQSTGDSGWSSLSSRGTPSQHSGRSKLKKIKIEQ